MPYPNIIIAGPPKAGTTSVFRYLAAHPDVCVSSIKEIHYFENYLDDINSQTLLNYESYFKHCSDQSIRVEVSPRYLQGGRPVAEAIYRTIPDVKIVFILREPVERFLSRYVSLMTKTERIPDEYHDLNKLVDAALAHEQSEPDPLSPEIDEEIIEYLWQGCYTSFVNEYIEIFSKDNVGILFFDELAASPGVFMEKLCKFTSIDHYFYDRYQFAIENKTRVVKFAHLHKIAEKTNRKLERIQNRLPALRRMIKNFYYKLLNPEVKKGGSKLITDYARQRLNEYYLDKNRSLREMILNNYPGIELPAWLSNHDSPQ